MIGEIFKRFEAIVDDDTLQRLGLEVRKILNMERSATDANSARAITAMIVMGVVGAFPAIMLPLTLGAMVDHLGFSAQQAGLIVSAEMAGVGIVTLGVLSVVHRWNRRHIILVGLIVMLAGNLLAVFADTYIELVAARCIAGLGAGTLVATMKASVAATRNSVRVFGIYGMSLLVCGVAGFPSMPYVIQPWGTMGAYVVLALLVLPGFLFLHWFPPYGAAAQQTHTGRQKLDMPSVVTGLTALLFYFISHGAVTAYMERLGVASGLGVDTVGKVLGAGAAAGIAGSALASWLNTRLGLARPLCFGILCSCVSLTVLVYGMQPGTYATAVLSYNFAFLLTGPFLLGSLSVLDRQGRVIVIGLMLQTAGFAIGPALGGLLISGADYVRIGWFGITFYILSLALFLPLLRRIDRRETHRNRVHQEDGVAEPASELSDPH